MKKTRTIVLISLISITISFCETKEKAQNDHEFDKGSKIESIELTDKNVENLALLGKVWGFLKYYHPNIGRGDYNWDYELFRILPKYQKAKNTNERDEILLNWVNSIGDVDESDDPVVKESSIKMKPDLDWITNSNLNPELEKQLTKIKNAERIDQHYYIQIGGRVSNPIFTNEVQYAEMKFPDTGFRLLSLFRYWNIVQYYFPYKYMIEEDWKAVLKEFIPKFINVKSELDYKLSIKEIITRIHDTHAQIYGMDSTLRKYNGIYFAPVKIKFIENKAVVTGYYDEVLGSKSGFVNGDVISKINGRITDEVVKEKLFYTSASNYPTQLRNIEWTLLMTNDSVIKLEYIRNQKTKTIQLKTYLIERFIKKAEHDTCLKFINKDIASDFLK